MSDHANEDGGERVEGHTAEIVRQRIDPFHGEETVEMVELVAEVEGCEVTDLPPLYECIDGVLEDVYSDPPSPAAQIEVNFSYAGYRITADQEGMVTLRKIDPTSLGEPPG